jgi:hypothetical protein
MKHTVVESKNWVVTGAVGGIDDNSGCSSNNKVKTIKENTQRNLAHVPEKYLTVNTINSIL